MLSAEKEEHTIQQDAGHGEFASKANKTSEVLLL